MQAEVKKKLETLRHNFAEVTGRPFSHFFCPILFRDEDSPLCKAHIVNSAFPKSSRRWTLQRQDVDSFYGAAFESDFVDLRHLRSDLAFDAVSDPKLYKRLRPRILLDGKPVEYFIAQGPIPQEFTQIVLERDNQTVRLAFKVSPADLASKTDINLHIEVKKDIRLAAVVSVLKAAHLTVFEMLGYRYALSLGGQYLGQCLGEFFLQNEGRDNNEVIKHAHSFFRPVAALVRPIAPGSPKPIGSIDDRLFRVCWCEGRQNMWGIIVFVRTHDLVHAALVPVFSDVEGADRFRRFVESGQDTLEVSIAQFADDHWQGASQRTTLTWPAVSLW